MSSIPDTKDSTPTPWRVGVGGRIEGERHVLADVLGYKGKEGMANAELIVRAVNCHDELLAALEAITPTVAPLDRYDGGQTMCDFCGELEQRAHKESCPWLRARAAIQKARGA